MAGKLRQWILGLVLAMTGCTPALAQPLDDNGDGLGDLWATRYGATGLPPLHDADRDGMSNALEAAAGTNPHDGGDILTITELTALNLQTYRVRWRSQPGKHYQLQLSGDLVQWAPLGQPIVGGTNPVGELTVEMATTFVSGGLELRRWNDRAWMPDLKTTVRGGTLAPTLTRTLTRLEVLHDGTGNWGQYVRGWIVPKVSGLYTFWDSSDDASEFWVSTDASPSNVREVAGVDVWTPVGNWTREAGQRSAPIALEAHRAYFFEAFHSAWSGGNHLQLAWSGEPLGNESPQIIGGDYLSPTGLSAEGLLAGRPAFFRLEAYDHDTDGDGLSDYEEHLAGLNPADATSSGRAADLDTVRTGLATPVGVTVGVAHARAFEATGQPARFTFFRSGGLAPVTLRYAVSGVAQAGADFAAVTGTLRLPMAASQVSLDLAPLLDGLLEAPESVTVTLLPDAAYTVGTPGLASATVEDAPDLLYVAQLRPPAEVRSGGYGTGAVRLAGNFLAGAVSLSFGNLVSPQLDSQFYVSDTGLSGSALAVLPAGQVPAQAWSAIAPGAEQRDALLAALAAGRLWVRVRSQALPEGEVWGRLVSSAGWSNFVPPAPPTVAAPTVAATDAEAARFLVQTTFGPDLASIARVRALGYAGWVNEQMALAPTYHRPYLDQRRAELLASEGNDGYAQTRQETWWQHTLTAPDQLRQRVAFALSQILVVSEASVDDTVALTTYYDTLVRHSFGNYRDLLEEVTRSPVMGEYLSSLRNRKPDPESGHQPDENFAREIMQLFSIGLSELHPDGTLKLNAEGLPQPTYTQADIVGLAHIFTGWGPHFDEANPPRWDDGSLARRQDWFYWGYDGLRPMSLYPDHHDTADRTIVTGATIPASLGGDARLEAALDVLFAHPNVGPFLARQLIQRLVTSNPSPGYIYRVTSAFNDNGQGVRGDLAATVRAILLDPEALSTAALADTGYGKLTEPILRVTRLLRAFRPTPYFAPGDQRFFFSTLWSMPHQAPLFAPSVFNFFQPGFVQPGPIAAAGLTAPEFQIFSETTATADLNQLMGYTYWGVGLNRQVNGNWASMPLAVSDLAGELMNPNLPVTERETRVLDALNLRLLAGAMTPATRQNIRDAWAALPNWFGFSAERSESRVRLAVFLCLLAPEYHVQR